MRRYPVTQQALAAVVKDAIRGAHRNPTDVARALAWPENAIRRMVKLDRDISVAELIAIGNEIGVRGSVLLARVERRLKG